jgi:hypothetical protein
MTRPELKTDPKYDDYDYPTTSPEGQSGHPGHTTPEQDAQVFQLRTQLEQEGYKERLDTLCMVSHACIGLHLQSLGPNSQQLRFLRARKFNVGLAKQM